MAFNASKCFLLRVTCTCSRDNVVNYTCTMMGQPITSVMQFKYLGVELDSKLTYFCYYRESKLFPRLLKKKSK